MPVDVDVVRAEVPTRLIHGPGALAHLSPTLRGLGVTRPMLVTDPGVAAAGLADRALEHLENAVVFDEVRPDRYARIAQGLGDTSGLTPLDAALAGVEELYRLTDDVGIPTMEELGFSEDEIPMLARIAFEDPQTIGNPREVEMADYEDIYRNAFSRGKR